MARARGPKRWACPKRVAPRAFDAVRWVGDPTRGLPPPYTEAELAVMLAGSAGLIIAISRATRAAVRAEAEANYMLNRKRFHRRPRKVNWLNQYA